MVCKVNETLRVKSVKPRDRRATHTEIRLVGINKEGKPVDNLIHSVYRESRGRGMGTHYTSDQYAGTWLNMPEVLQFTANCLEVK